MVNEQKRELSVDLALASLGVLERECSHPWLPDHIDNISQVLVAYSKLQEGGRMKLRLRRNVASTQAKGSWFCLHIGEFALYCGQAAKGHRLEILTPMRKWRWSQTER